MTKKRNFVPDDRVTRKWDHYHPEDEQDTGTVLPLDTLSDPQDYMLHVYVQWDKEWLGKEKVLIDDLLLEEEASKKLAILDKEFKEVERQVKSKLNEAASLIRESNKLAKKAGLENLASMYDAISPLEKAMDVSGWNTSSWNC